MRFSVWPGPHTPWAELLDLVLHVERTGWDGLWYADHFMPNSDQVGTPTNEAWTTLAALSARVQRVRLGSLVTGNTYRHPAVLAKMAVNVDVISGGRLVLGLGSGWQENEHKAYGIPFHDVRGRLDRLDEACQVIKQLVCEDRANFSGRFYQLEDAPLEPKPAGRMPLLIGGGGEKVTLRIVARHADEWNVWGTPDLLRHKMTILDRYCSDEGRDPKSIDRCAVALFFLMEDAAAAEKLRAGSVGRPMLVGSAEQLCEIVRDYAEAGVQEVVVPDFNLGGGEARKEALDRLMNEVVRELR